MCRIRGGTSATAANKDAELLASGVDVVKLVHRRANYKPEQAKDLVNFILGGSAVNMLSWGYRKVKLDVNEVVELPALVRLADIKTLYQSYKQCHNPVGRSSFFKLMKAATKGSSKIVTTIDYCSGILLNEPMEVVQDIIQYFYPNSRDATRLHFTKMLMLAKNFMSLHYRSHIHDDKEAFDSHGLQYALAKGCGHSSPRTSKSQECMFPFYVLQSLKDTLTNFSDDYINQLGRTAEDNLQFGNNNANSASSASSPGASSADVLSDTSNEDNDNDDNENNLRAKLGERITTARQNRERSPFKEKLIRGIGRNEKGFAAREDALRFLDETRNKFQLYQAHVVRTVAQRKHLDKELNDMKRLCEQSGESNALVIFDWKMKFQRMHSREYTPEHFGKRGLPWHGCMIIYHKRVNHQQNGVTTHTVQRLMYTWTK